MSCIKQPYNDMYKTTIQWHISMYIKMYKQWKNGEKIKQRDMVLVTKRKKCLQKINKREKKNWDLHD